MNKVGSLLFPSRCPFCKEVVESTEKCCTDCFSKLPYIGKHFCYKCGKQLEEDQFEYCHDCNIQNHFFRQGRGLYVHEDLVCDAIYDLKYKNKRQIADFFAEQIWEYLGEWIKKSDYSAIIPVPISEHKMKIRGYNQAELISRKLSLKAGIVHRPECLIRTSDTAPQRLLGRLERKNNLKNAFKTTTDRVQLEKVLLVDDIFTTGNTVDAVAEILLHSGVKAVDFITVSIGKGL